MGRSIHYSVNTLPMLMGVGPIPDEPHGSMIESARRLAVNVLEELDFPHEIRLVDIREDPETAWPGIIYGLNIVLKGPGRGCEEITFGWRQAQRGQDAWDGSHHCKTEYAAASRKTHGAVIQVLQAWDAAGMLKYVRDDAGQYRKPTAAHAHETGQTSQLSMLETA